MKNRITKLTALVAILCVLAMVFAVPLASAASYSKVYGQTQARIRVRENASTNAAVIDNIVKNACVYVTSSKTSGSMTFIQIKYRAADGDLVTGWVCQSDNSETYVKILSGTQAQSKYSVSGGSLPSTRVGTYTDSQRSASTKATSGSSYIQKGSSGSAVRDVQTKLKALGFYSGELTGNAGDKTVAAIKAFQKKYALTADGVAGPQTIAKIDAVYGESGSSASVSGGSGLRLGSSGSDVRNLQTDLTTLGYYWADITGNFGSKTESAVRSFQKAYGLTADGIAGSKTISAIASAVAKKGGSSSGSSSSSSGVALKLHSQGTKVSQLQQDLTALGFYSADITGNFGTKTEAAVKKFQASRGLVADGIAGTKTLEAIAAAAGGSVSSSISGLKLGSTSSEVRALQEDLTTLGYYYGDVTGHFGSMTEAAVRKFQKAKGLPSDGVAGKTTLNAIAAALGGSGSLVQGSSSGTSLREGDSGALVTDLQTRLKQLGIYYGEITGNFGSLTKKAVRTFQDDNDLTVDGIAGTKTLNLLYSKTGGGSVSNAGSGTTIVTKTIYGRIAKNNVNLRKSYSTSSAAITSMDDDDYIRITKSYTVNGVLWYYGHVEKSTYTYTGYVRSDMVEIIDEDDYIAGGGNTSLGSGETLGMIRVTDTTASLRAEPSSSSTKVDTVSKGDVFYYIDSVEGWFRTAGGYWIKKSDVEVLSPDEANDYVGTESGSTGTYKQGDTGSTVLWIQETLDDLGYYDGEKTGHYGSKTADAVMKFQRDHDLSGDGVVGPKTMAALRDAANGSSSGGSSDSTADPTIGTVYNVDWQDHKSELVSVFGFGSDGEKAAATLTDIATGKSFNIKIQSMGSHFDAEPVTDDDTDVLCSLYGVKNADQLVSQNKYGRRAMIITSHTGKSVICSIYAIPHGDQDITNNDYDGQFCLHTKNSMTHGTNRVDTDKYGHQETIEAGITALKNKGYNVDDSTYD